MTLNERLEQIGGCGDGNCKVYIRPGMHTNGGCRCLRRDPIMAERVISAYRAELDRLTAQLAEAEKHNEACERWLSAANAAINKQIAQNDDLEDQLAEREEIARELAEAINPFSCACFPTGICGEGHRWGYTVNNCAKAQAARALARFHAAEGESHDA